MNRHNLSRASLRAGPKPKPKPPRLRPNLKPRWLRNGQILILLQRGRIPAPTTTAPPAPENKIAWGSWACHCADTHKSAGNVALRSAHPLAIRAADKLTRLATATCTDALAACTSAPPTLSSPAALALPRLAGRLQRHRACTRALDTGNSGCRCPELPTLSKSTKQGSNS